MKQTSEKETFRPYIPSDKVVPEFTVTSVVLGILLAVVFGGANAYLGLRVGMTVSASIPAAVISMGVLRILLKRKSILATWCRQSVLQGNRSQREEYLHFRHSSCGQRRAAQSLFRPLPRLRYLQSVEACWEFFLWFRCAGR